MIDGHRLAAVAGSFQIQGKYRKAKRYGSGHIHDTYRVDFEGAGRDEECILQRINSDIFKDPVAVMQNIERVTDHLRLRLGKHPDVNRRVLQLVPARSGQKWHLDQSGGFWRVYRFIEGARTYDAVNSPAQAFEAAKAFGTFQRLLADLPEPRLVESIPDFHNTPKRFAAFRNAVESDVVGRCRAVRAEIAFALSRETVATALEGAGLPERVTHNDTKLNNVMIDDTTGEGICVIDLDTVMPGLAAYDFGDMVRTMTCPAAEDEQNLSNVTVQFDLFEAVLRGYLEGAEQFLSDEERASLITGAKVIVFEQGIRFLTDYLLGDTYYKVQRPEQNLHRCRTQFALLQSIDQQEDAMERVLRSM